MCKIVVSLSLRAGNHELTLPEVEFEFLAVHVLVKFFYHLSTNHNK